MTPGRMMMTTMAMMVPRKEAEQAVEEELQLQHRCGRGGGEVGQKEAGARDAAPLLASAAAPKPKTLHACQKLGDVWAASLCVASSQT